MPYQHEYRSYLLRLWPARTAGGIVWRASLEDAHGGVRIGFSSLRRLHEFLLDQTDEAHDAAVIGSADGAPLAERRDDRH